jgi:hypothetical protein
MASNIANEERIRTEPRRITVSARHSNCEASLGARTGGARAPQFPAGKGAEGSPATHAPGSGAEARRLGLQTLAAHGCRPQGRARTLPNAVGRGTQNWRETNEVYFRLQRKFGLIADSLCDATRSRSNFVKWFFR